MTVELQESTMRHSAARAVGAAMKGFWSIMSTGQDKEMYDLAKEHIAEEWDNTVGEMENFVAISDRKSTRLNSSHSQISYAVFCLKKKNNHQLAHSVEIHQLIPVGHHVRHLEPQDRGDTRRRSHSLERRAGADVCGYCIYEVQDVG